MTRRSTRSCIGFVKLKASIIINSEDNCNEHTNTHIFLQNDHKSHGILTQNDYIFDFAEYYKLYMSCYFLITISEHIMDL